ncbi:MAG: hypothetical protein ACRC46_13375 [Thermoguttaceae bacterium]
MSPLYCCVVVGVVILVYFCFIPSRFRATYETTGLRNPTLKNGKVDYFGVCEATYIDKLVPPEQNGMRDIMAALGPVALEYGGAIGAKPWEEVTTNDNFNNWFETYWIPLCEHMSIDPYKKPRFYDKRGFHDALQKVLDAKVATGGTLNERDVPPADAHPNNPHVRSANKMWHRLVAAPWKAEDEPEDAAWLADYSPVLDLIGRAARKPNYVCWRKPEENLSNILLPEVQSIRVFARSLRVRVTERLGRGDIDGAWYDVMSMLYLARHAKQDTIVIVNLVGIAIQDEAIATAKLILLHPAIDANHLRRFATDLGSLPPNTLVPNLAGGELFGSRETLQMIGLEKGGTAMNEFSKSDHDGPKLHNIGCLGGYAYFNWLPIDRNIAGKYLTKLWQEVYGDHWQKTPPLTHAETCDELCRARCASFRQGFVWDLLRLPLIRTRSQMATEIAFDYGVPAFGAIQIAFNRSTVGGEMLRTAIAILRYKHAHNEYPETLDALVPEFLEMYPINPFTGRSDFVYRRESWELESGMPTPFRLYVVGADGVDKGGTYDYESPRESCDNYGRVFF